MENARLPKLIGEEFICVRMHDAVLYCQELLAEEAGGKGHLATSDVAGHPVHTV